MKLKKIFAWIICIIFEWISYMILEFYFNNEWINGFPVYIAGLLFALYGFGIVINYERTGKYLYTNVNNVS